MNTFYVAVPAVASEGRFKHNKRLFTVVCCRCNKGVETVTAIVADDKLLNLVFGCHGAGESIPMTDERLKSDSLILAFPTSKEDLRP